jgi:hypothetical protein
MEALEEILNPPPVSSRTVRFDPQAKFEDNGIMYIPTKPNIAMDIHGQRTLTLVMCLPFKVDFLSSEYASFLEAYLQNNSFLTINTNTDAFIWASDTFIKSCTKLTLMPATSLYHTNADFSALSTFAAITEGRLFSQPIPSLAPLIDEVILAIEQPQRIQLLLVANELGCKPMVDVLSRLCQSSRVNEDLKPLMQSIEYTPE